MQPDKVIVDIVIREIDEGRHTRFALARKGWFKTPCDPCGRADRRCLVGMLMYATAETARRMGVTEATSNVVLLASERVRKIFEEEAHNHGYTSIQSLNDWGWGFEIDATVHAVAARA